MSSVNQVVYIVRGMTCSHCVAAVTDEILALPEVENVSVDLETKRVEVTGRNLDDAAIRLAVEEAGYDAA